MGYICVIKPNSFNEPKNLILKNKEACLEKGNIITDDADIELILRKAKTIAVLGLSPKPERDSNRVARYLQANGYRIFPVHPAQKKILGEKAYSSVEDIEEPVDIVDVFRNPAQVLSHAHEAIRIKPRVFWMQLNIENREAAKLLTEAGIDVIMNRCIKIDHARLSIA